MDIALSMVLYGAPWVLVVMGVAVAVKPPAREDRRARWKWIIGFAVVAALVTGAQVWSDVRDGAAREALETKLTGGDNFCYFRALLNEPQPGGGYEWELSNKEQHPIPGVKVCLYRVINGKDQFLRCWEEGMCIPHSIKQMADEGPLMPGKYRFIFFAANMWEQTLEISTEGDTLVQRGIIYRDGKEIWRFSDVAQ